MKTRESVAQRIEALTLQLRILKFMKKGTVPIESALKGLENFMEAQRRSGKVITIKVSSSNMNLTSV